ncbi:MAG: transcription antitermination factor NusB [Acidobacteriota bacterium]
MRALAAWVLDRTLETRSPSSVYLDSALARCPEMDRPLLRELALGSLRWLRRIDDVLERSSSRALDDIDAALRSPLRLATYQLLFLDRVPAHAAVDEAVRHARERTHRGGAGFVNAVLRRIARDPHLDAWPVERADPIEQLAIEKSHPDFLVRRWLDRYGRERTVELLDANNRPKPLHLLAFRDRGGREILAERLIDDDVAVEPSALAPFGLVVRRGNPLHGDAFRTGDAYVQDEASQVAALVPPPRAGERILDAAAAPGGKAFSILSFEPSARVVAADVGLGRLALLARNRERLGRDLPLIGADAGQPPLRAETFDRVVLDLPCTGTGTLRKNPEIKWRVRASEIGRLSRLAGRLLDGCAPRVVSGGLLVAITCSIEPEENEAVIQAFLDRHEGFDRVDLAARLEPPMDRHLLPAKGGWRMLPSGDHDGFTVHVIQRNGHV